MGVPSLLLVPGAVQPRYAPDRTSTTNLAHERKKSSFWMLWKSFVCRHDTFWQT